MNDIKKTMINDLEYQIQIFCELCGLNFDHKEVREYIISQVLCFNKSLTELCDEFLKLNEILEKMNGCEERKNYVRNKDCFLSSYK